MSKSLRKNGTTSNITRVKLYDSSSTLGSGLTGLTFSSTGLIISTIASNEATATAYTVAGSTIETITTLGTFAAPTSTKCRFKEVDATNHPGLYEIQIADARFAVANAKNLVISILGATNLAQTDVEIQLASVDPDSATAFITGVNSLAPPTNWNLESIDASGRVDIGKWIGVAPVALNNQLVQTDVERWLNGVIPTPNVTGVPLVDLKYTLGTISPAAAGSVRADAVTGSVGSVTGAVGSVTARVTANADQFAGQTITASAGVTLPASVASPTNITAGTITTATNLTNAPTAGDFTAAMKSSLSAATPSVTVSDKTGFSLSAAGMLAIWNQLTADAGILAGTFGLKLKNWVLGTDSKSLLSTDSQAGVVLPRVTLVDTVTTLTGHTAQTGDSFPFADRTVGRGTVSATSSTTTTFTPSALTPAGVAADQFKGRIIIFDRTTTTTALRGQATDITASSAAALPLLTFTALTTAPVSGDQFSII